MVDYHFAHFCICCQMATDPLENFQSKNWYWQSQFSLYHITLYGTILLIVLRGPGTLLRVTYVHDWPLLPFSQDNGFASYTSHFVCVNLIRDWGHQQFNVDSERQIFWRNFSWQLFIYSQRFSLNFAGNRRRNIFFLFRFDA